MKSASIPRLEKKILYEFKQELSVELKKNIVSIRVDGSRIRGDHRKDSDLDILVILKKLNEMHVNNIYDVAMVLSIKYSIYLSIKVFSEKEFNHYKNIPTRFAINVIKEGITI